MNRKLLSPSKPANHCDEWFSIKNFIILLLMVFVGMTGNAQVSAYTNEQIAIDPAYAPLDNATKDIQIDGIWTGTRVAPNVPIGFSFTFNGVSYTTLHISSAGFVTFGSAPSTSNTTPLSSTETYAGAISALGFDWRIGAVNSTGGVQNNAISTFLDTSGGTGNSIFKIEYRARTRSATGNTISFQIWLRETSNVVEFHYLNTGLSLGAQVVAQIGLRGSSSVDFQNLTGTGIWPQAPTIFAQGTAPTNTVEIRNGNNAIVNQSNRLFRWTPVSCPAPSSLALVTSTSNSATAAFLGSSPTNGFQYYLSTSPTPPTTGTTPTGMMAASPLNLSGLTGATTYYLWVRSDCDTSQSAWSNGITFTTLCTPSNIPYFLYVDPFSDGFATPGLPACTSTQAVAGNPWVTQTDAQGDGSFFSEHLVYKSSGSQAANSYFYTKGVNLVAGQTYRLSYTYGGSTNLSTLLNKMEVRFGNAPLNTAMTTQLADHPNIKESPLTNVVNFTAATSGAYYFGFRAYSDANMGDLYLDDIEIVESICLRPAAAVVSNVGYSSAIANWAAPSTAPLFGYSYYISTSPTPPTYTTVATGSVPAGVTQLSLSGLTGSTTYYLFIRGNCGEPDMSEWSTAASFTTSATPPYCIPTASTSASTYITSFSTTGAVTNVNNSSGFTTPGYADYTSLVVTESQGGSFDFSLSLAGPTVGIAIWIDWNGNGTFETTERVYHSGTSYVDGPASGTITVPTAAPLGITRMRVMIDYWATSPNPCAFSTTNPSRGEIEDYSFKVVVPPPPLTITPLTATQCAGANSTLITLTSPVGNYDIYSWSPSTGVTGNATTGWTIAAGSSLTYTLTGTQTGGAQSVNTAQFNYVALPLPTPITIVASNSGAYCQGSTTAVELAASGGVVSGVPVYSENFNSGAGGWTRTTVGSTGTTTQINNAAWTVRPAGFMPLGGSWFNTAVRSNDDSAYFFTDGDVQGIGNLNRHFLYSPSFSLAGYTAASLNFWHFYRQFTTSTARVEISTNSTDDTNGNWTTLQTYTSSQGAPTSWVNVVLDLGAYVGQPNVRLRFNFQATWGWGWGIDNVLVSGSATSAITWSPAAGLFMDAAMTTPYIANTGAQIVYAAPSATQVYTASASTPAPTICSTSTASTVTVTTVGGGTISPLAQTVCGSVTPITLSGFSGTVTGWQWSTSPTFTTPTDIPGSASATLTAANIGTFAGTRYYRAVLNTGSCTVYMPTIASGITVSVSFASTTWNGTAWNNGVPTINTAAIFAGNYTATANLSACSVQINSGNVVVNSGITLTVQNAVTVSGGSLTFEDDASLVQINDLAENIGSMVYKRQTTPMQNYDYTYWSSPLFPQTLLGVSPLTMADKYMRFDTAANDYISVPPTSLMEPGKGYIIRTPQNWSTGPYMATFTGGVSNNGVANNGVIGVPIILAGSNNFNLIGNPYPSAIDADLFYAANSALIDGTFYFWTHNTPINPLEYDGDDYAIWNSVGGIGAAGGGTGNTTIPNGNIAAGQGFFVKSIANGSANFNNSMRLTGLNNQFYRMAGAAMPQVLEKHRVWLELKNSAGAFKQTLIGYVQEATNGKDSKFDGDYLDAGNMVGLYSLLGDDKLSIQGRALPFNVSDVIPLGAKFTTAGNFEIALSDFDGLFETHGIYLEDLLLNVTHDLKSGSYTFASQAGNFNARFQLRFTGGTALGTGDNAIDQNSVVVYKNGDGIHINTGNATMSTVKVLDIRGRLVHQKNNIQNTTTTLANLNVQEGVLIVQVTLENGLTINKRIVY